MKKNMIRKVASVFAVAYTVVGCKSIDPLSLDVTASDREVFTDANAPQKANAQFKILVISKAKPNEGDPAYDQKMADSARTSVMKYFSNLGWFETIDDKNGIALDAGDLVGDDGRAKSKVVGESDIDFILSVKSSVAYPANHFKWHEFWGSGRYTSGLTHQKIRHAPAEAVAFRLF